MYAGFHRNLLRVRRHSLANRDPFGCLQEESSHFSRSTAGCSGSGGIYGHRAIMPPRSSFVVHATDPPIKRHMCLLTNGGVSWFTFSADTQRYRADLADNGTCHRSACDVARNPLASSTIHVSSDHESEGLDNMTSAVDRNLHIGVLDPDVYANGDPATYGLPLDQYTYLRENEPVYRQTFDDPLLIKEVWVLTRYDDILAVDRDADTFAANRGHVNIWTVNPIDPTMGGKPAMLTQDGADHRRHRLVVGRAFTPTMVRRLEEKFRGYARTVVDEALEKGSFDFVTDVAHAMPMEALGDVLGVPAEDRPKFFNWVDRFAAPFDTRMTPSFEAVIEAIFNLTAYAGDLAAHKRIAPGDDVVTQMVQADKADTMSEDEILGNIVLLASGAAESTRSALSHAMHQLMRDPDQMAWLREHSDDIPDTAIQEMVRVATPFLHFVRTVTKDIELHGQPISAGDRVCMLLAAGNFDPEVFDDAQRFDLARTPNRHLSFGRGQHSCLGKHIAVLEMKILLEELLQRTKDIRPAGDIAYVRDVFSRGVYELPVTITPA